MTSATATGRTLRVTETDIVIAGGGPVGLMLACELRLAGADPVVLERLPETSPVPKGNGLVGQSVTMLDYRGLLDRFRAEAAWAGPVPSYSFGPLELDFSALDSSPLTVMAIPQRRLEEQLAGRLAELGGTVCRGHELTAFAEDEDGTAVTVDVRSPAGDYRLRARYLVGCDGARSQLRKQAGIGFPGVTSSEISRIGRVVLPTARLARGGREVTIPGIGRLKLMSQVRTPAGAYSLAPLAMLDKKAPAGAYIVATSEDDPAASDGAPMTLDELRASVRRVTGGDLPMADPLLLTRVVGNSRLADRYRAGRVLLAGDAAHIFGLGGSMNAGLLDAVNLGWKLAAQVRAEARGQAPDGLLDSYDAERHLAGQHTIRQTRAQRALTVLSGPGTPAPEGAAALRELFGDVPAGPDPLRRVGGLLAARPGLRRELGELIAGSDVRYPMPGNGPRPHPLVGRLVPDLRLETGAGRTRVAGLMPAARGVLLDFTPDAAAAPAAAPWAGQVTVVKAGRPDAAAPAALLIRPDGYVAWAAEPGTPDPTAGLGEALRAWFGLPG